MPRDSYPSEGRDLFNITRVICRVCLLIACAWPCTAGAVVNDLLKLEATPSVKATSSLLLDITRAGNRLVAVGERGHIIYSEDNGENWSQGKVPVMVTLTAVDFPTPEMGWAVGHDGIVLHTEDGGRTWVERMNGDDANKLLLAKAERALQQKATELETAEEGETADIEAEIDDLQWAVESAKIAVREGPWKAFMDVEFEDEKKGFIIGSYGMIFGTEDGGRSWVPLGDRVPNPDLLHLNAFGRTRSGMFMVGEEGTLYRSRHGEMRWEAVDSPYEGSFFGVVTEEDSDTVIALGLRGNAFHSDDFGDTWKKIDIQTNTSFNGGYLFPDGRVVILSNEVFLGRNVLTEFKSLNAPYSVYSSLAVDDSNLILVGSRGVYMLPIPDTAK
jgi:photosystem II stability/assembly factor-like uncharacterized protein